MHVEKASILLKDRRYEESLAAAQAAAEHSPTDPEVRQLIDRYGFACVPARSSGKWRAGTDALRTSVACGAEGRQGAKESVHGGVCMVGRDL